MSSRTPSQADTNNERFKGLEFVAGIAHDLKTPLATIATSAELLEQDLDDATSSHLIKVIQRQAERLNKMILELSDHLRVDSPDVRLRQNVFYLTDLVRETASDFRRFDQSHRLVLDLPEREVEIEADQHKMRRILDNLLRNAFNYSPPETTVTLRVRFTDGAVPSALIEVDDEGSGIPASMRHKIFEPFFRLPGSQADGQGLGLHIVRLLVEAHGGKVWNEASPAGGARFCISLPLHTSTLD